MCRAAAQDEGRKSWYPTILGCGGDEECGLLARLYYTDMADDFGDRKWIARDIEFTPTGGGQGECPPVERLTLSDRGGQGQCPAAGTPAAGSCRPRTVILTEAEQHGGVLRAGQELQQVPFSSRIFYCLAGASLLVCGAP